MKKHFLRSLLALPLLAAALAACNHQPKPVAAPAGVTSEKDFAETLKACAQIVDEQSFIEIRKVKGGYVFQVRRKPAGKAAGKQV